MSAVIRDTDLKLTAKIKAIPACEAWLFENKAMLASVKRGLAQAATGGAVNLGSFAKHAKEQYCGPDEISGGKRIPILTILAITPHP